MATLTLTLAKGTEAGAIVRRLGEQIMAASSILPDANPTGASVTLVFDNAPSAGSMSVQITGGPTGAGSVYYA